MSSVLGSYLAKISSPEDVFYHIEDELSVERIFFGGFLVILGARLADGCTSGHGITGMGHLALRSMIAVGCMFGTAILATLAIRHGRV